MEIRRISDVLKERYGEKVYRLSLSSGCTCPNRDGTAGYGGCTFCSAGGAGEFASGQAPIALQLREAKGLIRKKTDAAKFIAYFQSFSNTYGDPERLEALYRETLSYEEILILSIGTRPDCLPPDMVEMLRRLNQIKPVWTELGLQTIHEKTAAAIHRGYSLPVFEEAYQRLKTAGIEVIIHLILGLPGETEEEMLETMRYVSRLNPIPDGIKLHMLQILEGTTLGEEYRKTPFPVMPLEEYGRLLIRCLQILPKETVIHRFTGDGPKKLLIAPAWSADKKRVLNTLNKMIREAPESGK